MECSAQSQCKARTTRLALQHLKPPPGRIAYHAITAYHSGVKHATQHRPRLQEHSGVTVRCSRFRPHCTKAVSETLSADTQLNHVKARNIYITWFISLMGLFFQQPSQLPMCLKRPSFSSDHCQSMSPPMNPDSCDARGKVRQNSSTLDCQCPPCVPASCLNSIASLSKFQIGYRFRSNKTLSIFHDPWSYLCL